MELGTVITVLWALTATEEATNGVAADPAREQADAYVALVQADRLYEQSNYPHAVVGYRDALDRYTRLSVDNPDWEAEIVQYRLAYCANQMEAVFSKSGRNETQLLAEAAGAPDEETKDGNRLAALAEENKYLRQRISELQGQEVEDPLLLAAEVERLEGENKRLLEKMAVSVPRESVSDELAREMRAEDSLEKPTPKERPLTHGLELEQKKQYEKAVKIYETIGDADSDYNAAVRGRARCGLRLGQSAGVLTLMEKAGGNVSEDDAARLLWGLALVQEGRYAEAVEKMEPLSSKYSGSPEYRTGMGAALLGAGRIAEARTELEKALSLDPQPMAAHYNLAQVFLLSSPPDPQAARDHYQQAVKLGGGRDPAMEEAIGKMSNE